jgi:hypothetical protein
MGVFVENYIFFRLLVEGDAMRAESHVLMFGIFPGESDTPPRGIWHPSLCQALTTIDISCIVA